MATNPDPPIKGWDTAACAALIDEMWALRQAMLSLASRLEPLRAEIAPAHQASAVNLAHYLALRRFDLRRLQERLSGIGVSSLGRAETHVLANLDKVLGILHRLGGRPWEPLSADEPTGSRRGPALLAAHGEALFGSAPPERRVRIMVTLPSEAAHDTTLVDRLVEAGMDVARINCAHDDAAAWRAMAVSVRRASGNAGRPVRVLMDLGGPKLRTGAVAGGPAVVKLRPWRDALGRVVANTRFGLHAAGSAERVDGVGTSLAVDLAWLDRLAVGARIDLVDAREARRRLEVVEKHPHGAVVECGKTLYLTNGVVLRLHSRGRPESAVSGVPAAPGRWHLFAGQRVRLIATGDGHDAVPAARGHRARPATISCTLPEALSSAREGERIWFDDGRIGGIVRRSKRKHVEIEIVHAREQGEKLVADKGINLPDTRLDLPALTAQDLEDLDTVAACADMVGLSFAQSATDVHALREQLLARGAGHVGVILKIETRRGFEHLPEMLFAAMRCPAAGVMIARGDLAVECGYERLAEVQEEILWICEAAHMPVVWATQVLETLAKTGVPSRAEITDAAMGVRAECVMLNKGAQIVHAMRTLDDILRRMQAHQSKKRPLLRALKSWRSGLDEKLPAALRPES